MSDQVEQWSTKYGRVLPPKDQRKLVQSVLKGIELIESFLGGPRERSLTDLVKLTGLPMPTVHRLLGTLEYGGWVDRGAGGGYVLSLRIAELARHVLAGINLRDQALPVMQTLTKSTGETSYLVVRESNHAVCIERVESYNMVRVMAWDVGSVLPLYAGAGPLSLLAYQSRAEREQILGQGDLELPIGTSTTTQEVELKLESIRQQGFSISSEETIPGITSVGAPIVDRSGQVIASFSVGGMSTAILGERCEALTTALLDAGLELSRRLGYQASYPLPAS